MIQKQKAQQVARSDEADTIQAFVALGGRVSERRRPRHRGGGGGGCPSTPLSSRAGQAGLRPRSCKGGLQVAALPRTGSPSTKGRTLSHPPCCAPLHHPTSAPSPSPAPQPDKSGEVDIQRLQRTLAEFELQVGLMCVREAVVVVVVCVWR